MSVLCSLPPAPRSLHSPDRAFLRHHGLGIVLVDDSLYEKDLLGAFFGVGFGGFPTVGLGDGAAGFEVDGRGDADHFRDFVVADEAAGGGGVFGVNVDGNIQGVPQGGEHLKLNVTHGVEGVGPDLLEQFGGAWISVSGVGGNLEFAVGWDFSGGAGFVENP